MKKHFNLKKVAVIGAMAFGGILAAAPTNHAAAFRLWSNDFECDADGTSRRVQRIFGVKVGENESGIPNSALCN